MTTVRSSDDLDRRNASMPHRPGLLVSVRSALEAELVVAAGVECVDVKEPSRGALGAPTLRTISAVAQRNSGRSVLSVALGELLDGAAKRAASLAELREEFRPRFAKIGLRGCAQTAWGTKWKIATSRLPEGTWPVAVIYADAAAAGAPEFDEVVETCAMMDCRFALVDTFNKDGPRLAEIWSLEAMQQRVARARDRGVRLSFAGKLTMQDVDRMRTLDVVFLGVRSAACDGDRLKSINAMRVKELQEMVTHGSVHRREAEINLADFVRPND